MIPPLLDLGLSGVASMTSALQVGLIEKERPIATILSDMYLSSNDVIDVCARSIATAEDRDLAHRIARDDVGRGAPAPLRAVVESTQSVSPAPLLSCALVFGSVFLAVAADAASAATMMAADRWRFIWQLGFTTLFSVTIRAKPSTVRRMRWRAPT